MRRVARARRRGVAARLAADLARMAESRARCIDFPSLRLNDRGRSRFASGLARTRPAYTHVDSLVFTGLSS
jgi:hypothetical protein